MPYGDWRLMTRWQRMDLLVRHQMELRDRAKRVRGKGLREILAAVVERVLGF